MNIDETYKDLCKRRFEYGMYLNVLNDFISSFHAAEGVIVNLGFNYEPIDIKRFVNIRRRFIDDIRELTQAIDAIEPEVMGNVRDMANNGYYLLKIGSQA